MRGGKGEGQKALSVVDTVMRYPMHEHSIVNGKAFNSFSIDALLSAWGRHLHPRMLSLHVSTCDSYVLD